MSHFSPRPHGCVVLYPDPDLDLGNDIAELLYLFHRALHTEERRVKKDGRGRLGQR
jgi:hypothetical protein